MPSSDYTPTLDEVGATTRSRTHDDVGNELGTFTIDTRPDMFAVDSLIDNAVNFIEGFAAAGGITEIGEGCYQNAKTAVIYRVCFLIEIGFFPEQIAGDHSPYDEFLELYKAAINQLARCLGIAEPDDDPQSGGTDQNDIETALPQFGFPSHVASMTEYLERRPSWPFFDLNRDFLGVDLPEVSTVALPIRVSEVGDGVVYVNDVAYDIQRVPVNISGPVTDQVVVAAVAGQKIRVIGAHALARSAAATLTFKSKGSGAGTAISPIYDNGAHGGFVMLKDKDGIFETNVGEALAVDAGAALGIMISYLEV